MKAPIAVGLLVALLSGAGVIAQTSESQPGDVELQINGTLIDATGGRGVFSGDIDLSRFKAEVQGGAIVVLGTVTGILTDSAGTPLGRAEQEVTLPVSIVRSSCELLHLEFGPAEIEILGLPVHFQKVTIGITQRYGPRPQFGALLCSTARLIESHPPPDSVATTLNTVLHAMELPKYFRPSRES